MAYLVFKEGELSESSFDNYLLPVNSTEYRSMEFHDHPQMIEMPEPTEQQMRDWDPEEFSLEEYLTRDVYTSVLDLTSDSRKLLVRLNMSWFHFLHDQIPAILYEIEKYPDIEVIIVTTGKFEYTDPGTPGAILIEILNSFNIQYKIVKKFSYKFLKINNFIFSGNLSNLDILQNSYKFYEQYLTNKEIVPYRKVFLSRKKVRIHTAVRLFGQIMDNRIDDHEGLEDFFRDLGFEIVYAEDILDFKERINFFNEVEILASLSGSGLTNAVFMQEGTTMIEITTPLVVFKNRGFGIDELAQEIHSIYVTLAKTKNILYFSIFNLSRSLEEFKKLFLSSKTIRKILNIKENKDD